MFLADKHNFGQQVEKVQRASDTWYRKPRSVYWEWLFFGKDSPLKHLFNEVGKNGNRPLSDYFFNLEVEMESNWSGFSKEVPTEKQIPTPEHFYSFGALIAYCYIFGIRDLHKQNLVITRTHLQPVDAEVVWTSLTLPHETLLLPFKTVGYEFAGIGALVNSKEELTKEQVERIVLGYWDLFELISRQKNEIDKILASLDFSEIPVRVIIRNTSEYRDLLKTPPENTMPSEVEQLKRGDIPFYFKFVADENLYWLKSKNLPEVEKAIVHFRRDIDRHAQNFMDQTIEKTVASSALVKGLLFLMKAFSQDIQIKFSEKDSIAGGRVVIGNQVFTISK
jgi:hypothetical protein